MKISRNYLYIIGLSFAVYSCTSQQPTKNNGNLKKTPPKIQPTAVTPTQNSIPSLPEKPKVDRENGEDYYKVNIADITKNDNTISYGSIVTAKPEGFKVVKTYYPAVGQNFRQRYIILHYTALDDDRSVRVLTEQSVSAHYLVNAIDDKEIYQLVDENKRAYHAGISQWRADSQLNDTSIGIEIVNAGYRKDSLGARVFPTYPDFQVKKVAALVKDLVSRYNIPATNVLGHSDIAPTRKQDPGPQFPWKKLYDEYQIGMWYDEPVKQSFYSQTMSEDFELKLLDQNFVYQFQTALKNFGYSLPTNGILDDATKKTIEAFQYHFRPTNYSGVMDGETWAILQALLQKYPVKK